MAILEVIKLILESIFGRITNSIESVVSAINLFQDALTIPYSLIPILPSFLGASIVIISSVSLLKFILGR